MKVVSYQVSGNNRFGILDGESVIDAGENIASLLPTTEIGKITDMRLSAPVPLHAKVICIGLNYRDHAEESGQEIPEEPIIFAKFPSSITGHLSPIMIPPEVTQPDYEAELGIVIGRRTKRVLQTDAMDFVLGYTCLNDVSARNFQFADGQWVRGKSLDTFCPIGPWIVSSDEVPDPQSLSIRCVLNEQVVQESSTKQMIFTAAELISFVSRWITLEPGDVIATGTPPGVGFARKPQLFLKDGDRVTVEIEGIGSLTNPVRAEAAK